jgi:hypothetical protein
MCYPELSGVGEACTAEWACLEAHLPGQCARQIGIVLLESGSKFLHLKVQQNWWLGLVDREEHVLWEALSADLRERARVMSGKAFLEWFEDSCSHVIRLGHLQSIEVRQIETTLARIYSNYVTTSEPGEHTSGIASEPSALRHKYRHRVLPPTVSGKMWRSGRSWILQGAIAATFLLGAGLVGIYSPVPAMNEHYERIVSREIQLPLTSDYHYQAVHFAVGPLVNPHPSQHNRKNKHTRRVRARKFVAPDVSLYRSSQVAQLEPPSCCDARPEMDEPTLFSLQFEPEVPEFHPRHSRVVRILVAAATPFRFLASR